MEEKKEEKLTYEQLEKYAAQLQNSLISMNNQLRQIDFASMRLKWLFKVLKYENEFPAEFVVRCAKEIENLLTIEVEVKAEDTEK